MLFETRLEAANIDSDSADEEPVRPGLLAARLSGGARLDRLELRDELVPEAAELLRHLALAVRHGF